MAEHDPSAPLTEPYQVDCVFITGAAIEVSRHVMRLIGWASLPNLGGEMDERRIMVRFAMPIDAARRLRDDMRLGLPR